MILASKSFQFINNLNNFCQESMWSYQFFLRFRIINRRSWSSTNLSLDSFHQDFLVKKNWSSSPNLRYLWRSHECKDNPEDHIHLWSSIQMILHAWSFSLTRLGLEFMYPKSCELLLLFRINTWYDPRILIVLVYKQFRQFLSRICMILSILLKI
jgi:hypothetical protein